MPSLTPPLPTTTTPPTTLPALPLTSTNDLCHALSRYPEIVGMVVRFWNGEPRLGRDLRRLRRDMKLVCKAARRDANDTEEHYCHIVDFSIELDTILQCAIHLLDLTPTPYTLRQVLRFCAAAFRKWPKSAKHEECEWEDANVEGPVQEACKYLSEVLASHAHLLNPEIFMEAFSIPQPKDGWLPGVDYLVETYHEDVGELAADFGYTDITIFFYRPENEPEFAYFGIPWEISPGGNGTVTDAISLDDILVDRGRTFGCDWDDGNSEGGNGEEGGHGVQWCT